MTYPKECYKLAAQCRGFYDTPLLGTGEEIPRWGALFDWSDTYFSSKPSTSAGSLKEEMFDTYDKRILYLQGILEDNDQKSVDEGILRFANSNSKVERVKRWLNDVAHTSLLQKTFGTGVSKHVIEYTFPICHTLTVSMAVIDYVRTYKTQDEL